MQSSAEGPQPLSAHEIKTPHHQDPPDSSVESHKLEVRQTLDEPHKGDSPVISLKRLRSPMSIYMLFHSIYRYSKSICRPIASEPLVRSTTQSPSDPRRMARPRRHRHPCPMCREDPRPVRPRLRRRHPPRRQPHPTPTHRHRVRPHPPRRPIRPPPRQPRRLTSVSQRPHSGCRKPGGQIPSMSFPLPETQER